VDNRYAYFILQSYQSYSSITEKSAVQLPTTPTSVEDWLAGMGLVRYWPAFRDSGYDVMGTITQLDEATLVTLGVSIKPHIILLLSKAKDIVLL
jgi:SAM domain (Sterile alpha motif)